MSWVCLPLLLTCSVIRSCSHCTPTLCHTGCVIERCLSCVLNSDVFRIAHSAFHLFLLVVCSGLHALHLFLLAVRSGSHALHSISNKFLQSVAFKPATFLTQFCSIWLRRFAFTGSSLHICVCTRSRLQFFFQSVLAVRVSRYFHLANFHKFSIVVQVTKEV